MPRRLMVVLMLALAVLAISMSVHAVRQVNAPPPPLADSPVLAAAMAPPATQAPADDGSATVTADPPAQDGPAVDLATWTSALSPDGAHLLVVGDGYSNLPSQWVQQWGVLVGAERPVAIRHWGEAADVSFNEPIELSTGDGPSLTVWSASRDGSTVQDAVERLDRFASDAADPDAILVSLGQGSGGEDVAGALDALLEGLPDVPVLLVVGPAGLYDAGVGDAIAGWGEEHSERVVTVDLRDAVAEAPTAEEWALAFQDALGG